MKAGSTILLRSDNMTTVSQPNRQSNSKNLELLQLTKGIWNWYLRNKVFVKAIHINKEENGKANYFGRIHQFNSQANWVLNTEAIKMIKRFIGNFSVNLFATNKNKRHNQFVELYPANRFEVADATSMNKLPDMALAHLPNIIIGRVRKKAARSNYDLILVTSFWRNQSWFPLALQQSVAMPMIPEKKYSHTTIFNKLIVCVEIDNHY